MINPKTTYELLTAFMKKDNTINIETIIDNYWIRKDRTEEIWWELNNIRDWYYKDLNNYKEPVYINHYVDKACRILETYCDLNYILP